MSVSDRRHGNTGWPKAIRSSASIDQVNSVIEEMHQTSVRRLLGHLTNKASVSSVCATEAMSYCHFGKTAPLPIKGYRIGNLN